MTNESRAQINRRAYVRKLESDASDHRVKSNLTANPVKASFVRDPETGHIFPRQSEVFRRCLTKAKS